MKEVTRWNNRTRMMYVWDDDEKLKRKALVVYINHLDRVPVLTLELNGSTAKWYKHCAEIEDEETGEGVMTRQEVEVLKNIEKTMLDLIHSLDLMKIPFFRNYANNFTLNDIEYSSSCDSIDFVGEVEHVNLGPVTVCVHGIDGLIDTGYIKVK